MSQIRPVKVFQINYPFIFGGEYNRGRQQIATTGTTSSGNSHIARDFTVTAANRCDWLGPTLAVFLAIIFLFITNGSIANLQQGESTADFRLKRIQR